jgi:formylglycine-generating enzyme required for sulfatase activity
MKQPSTDPDDEVNPASAPPPVAPLAATSRAPFVNSLGMAFVPVPIAGGASGGVALLFSVWPTRVQDYAVFVSETGTPVVQVEFEQQPDHPAADVTWERAAAFCAWLSQKEGRTYRLPTDHEWSCAAGMGEQEDPAQSPRTKNAVLAGYLWGAGYPPPENFGNYDPRLEGEDFTHTSPVHAFPPQKFGLCDLSGNVWEWCEDWYDAVEQKFRVMRGGSWVCEDEKYLRSSYRHSDHPTARYSNYGFRCVLVPGDV